MDFEESRTNNVAKVTSFRSFSLLWQFSIHCLLTTVADRIKYYGKKKMVLCSFEKSIMMKTDSFIIVHTLIFIVEKFIVIVEKFIVIVDRFIVIVEKVIVIMEKFIVIVEKFIVIACC